MKTTTLFLCQNKSFVVWHVLVTTRFLTCIIDCIVLTLIVTIMLNRTSPGSCDIMREAVRQQPMVYGKWNRAESFKNKPSPTYINNKQLFSTKTPMTGCTNLLYSPKQFRLFFDGSNKTYSEKWLYSQKCLNKSWFAKPVGPMQRRTQKIFGRGFIHWHMVIICI